MKMTYSLSTGIPPTSGSRSVTGVRTRKVARWSDSFTRSSPWLSCCSCSSFRPAARIASSSAASSPVASAGAARGGGTTCNSSHRSRSRATRSAAASISDSRTGARASPPPSIGAGFEMSSNRTIAPNPQAMTSRNAKPKISPEERVFLMASPSPGSWEARPRGPAPAGGRRLRMAFRRRQTSPDGAGLPHGQLPAGVMRSPPACAVQLQYAGAASGSPSSGGRLRRTERAFLTASSPPGS